MNIEYMKNFLVIQDCGSYSRASEQLYISQPALTKQIKKLESEIGQELFMRNTRSLKLTESGEIFFRYASHICEQYDRMMKDIDQGAMSRYSSLRIGYVTTGQKALIEHAAAQLMDRYENLDMDLVTGMPQELTDMILNNQLDCAIFHLPSVDGIHEIQYDRLLACGITARMSKHNKLASKKELSIADLQDCEILTSEGTCPRCRDFINEAFEKAGYPIHRRYVKNIATVEMLSASRNSVSLTSSMNPVTNPNMVKIPVKEIPKGFDLILAWKAGNHNPFIQSMSNLLKKDL